MIVFWVCLACLAVVLLQMTFLIFFWKTNFRETKGFPVDRPAVSVLIAARDEEDNIRDCLQSMAALDYPPEKLEVLVGNDRSGDSTKEVTEAFIREKGLTNFFCYDITSELGQAKGKANVLAQLARRASGQYLFFADADTRVGPQWVQAMLAGFYTEEQVGIVTGVTTIEGPRIFDKMQAIDWFYALGMVKVVTDLKRPVTAMGNNMAVTREAYDSTGGYENIPFSVTEDYALFHEMRKHGWNYFHVFNKEALGHCVPVNTFLNLLHQRKRWMYGLVQLPWYLLSFLIGQALFFPCIAVLLGLAPWLGLAVWGVKLLLQSIFVGMILNRTHCRTLKKYLGLFEIYSLVLTVLTAVYYLLPLKFKWKGREYK